MGQSKLTALKDGLDSLQATYLLHVMDEKIGEALSNISYGLYVVSSVSKDGRMNGQIVNTAFQVTSNPAKIAVSINKSNLTHKYISESKVFSVSVLEETTPFAFIGLFGFKSGKDIDKFSNTAFKKGITGCPLATQHALSVIEAEVEGSFDAGSHTVFFGKIVSADVLKEGTALTYLFYKNNMRGKTPKTATTYRARNEIIGSVEPIISLQAHNTPDTMGLKLEQGGNTMKKYVCKVCGYVYDPQTGDAEHNIAPGTAFEKLPSDWVCPLCGAGKEEFEPEN